MHPSFDLVLRLKFRASESQRRRVRCLLSHSTTKVISAPILCLDGGGTTVALARGRAEVEAACPRPSSVERAVDLGAGFGTHAIPLADLGYSVLAIDSSGTLLDVIRNHESANSILTVQDDPSSFKNHLTRPGGANSCMGDTLTHSGPTSKPSSSPSPWSLETLVPGGILHCDVSRLLHAAGRSQRFIPVRSDPDRIPPAFSQYEAETVMVHDIPEHQRTGADRRQRVSAYRKLRLSPDWVTRALESQGLSSCAENRILAGMVRLLGTCRSRRLRAGEAYPFDEPDGG